MHEAGHSKPVLWNNSEGWGGERGGKGVQGWCTGMTLRDRMGRKVGGRFRMGNTCTVMADSCRCMAKTTAIL